MSKTKYLWWGYVNNMLKNYPRRTSEKETQAIAEAIELTKNMPNGDYRYEAVRLVFFDGTHTTAGAALCTSFSEDTVQNWLRDFKFLVAIQHGLTKDYLKKP